MPEPRSKVRTDQDIRKLAKTTVLRELRALYLDAKRAKLQAETVQAHAAAVMGQIQQFADRIRHGELSPYEALAILDPAHPDVEEWMALTDARAAELASETREETCGADVG